MDIGPSVKDILEKDLLELIGAGGLAEDKKAEVYGKIVETIRYRTIEAIDRLLSLDEVDAFKAAIDKDDSDGIQKFLMGKGINVEDVMLEEAVKYKIEIASYVDYLNQAGKVANQSLNNQNSSQ